MTRGQIQFILGNPVLEDAFDPNRWNYIYTVAYPDQPIIKKELIVVFEDDRLIGFEGDYIPTGAQPTETYRAALALLRALGSTTRGR